MSTPNQKKQVTYIYAQNEKFNNNKKTRVRRRNVNDFLKNERNKKISAIEIKKKKIFKSLCVPRKFNKQE